MFFSACTKSFGNYLKDLRISLGFSQEDVESLSGVSTMTLKRIEKGKVLPRLDTLGYLSVVYKKDLILDLREYCNSNDIYNYYSRLEYLIISYNVEKLQDLNSDFKKFVERNEFNSTIPMNTVIPTQFKMVLEGISKYYTSLFKESYNDFLNAIEISNPTFSIESFSEYKYDTFEMRILLMIALSLVHKKQITQSISILIFLLDNSNFDKRSSTNEKLLIIKIYLNLSYNYHRLNLHDKALDYANAGIEFCNNNHLSYALAQLYSRKGIAEFLSNKPDYISSLEQSICLMTMTNQKELAIKYLNIMQKSYNITLPSFSYLNN